MAWAWTYEQDGGAQTSAAFPSQTDAEAWLSESWSGLRDAGVREVTLTENGRAVYGPMGLDAV